MASFPIQLPLMSVIMASMHEIEMTFQWKLWGDFKKSTNAKVVDMSGTQNIEGGDWHNGLGHSPAKHLTRNPGDHDFIHEAKSLSKMQKKRLPTNDKGYHISGESNGTLWGAVCGNCG